VSRSLCRPAAPFLLGLSLAAALAWVPTAPAAAAQVESLLPSDRLTVPDPGQATGRRMALPLPDCGLDAAGCDEVRLLNELDGWSVNPRIAIRFSGPVALDSVTRATAFIVPLWAEPLPSPVGLTQLVWDAEHNTLYARPQRSLLQARRYALVLTAKVLDESGQPLVPLAGRGLVSEAAQGVSAQGTVLQQLKTLGLARRDLAAVSVFTTQSVTAGLEQMRAAVDLGPAPVIHFTLGPGGARSVYARVGLDGIELRRQVAADPAAALEEPEKMPLDLVPPTEIRAIAFGRFTARSFLTADRHVPATATRSEAPAPQGSEDVDVTIFMPAGTMPRDGWPVAIFGHGFGNERHSVPMVVAGTMARAGFATVAINVVGHGGGPAGTLTVSRTGQEPVTLPAGGRGLDLNGDGRIGVTEGVATRAASPLALIGGRDGLRQTTADLMQLVRAIHRGVDVDGDGRIDLDRERIQYFGQSFGGIYGTLLMAVDPAVRIGVLNVAGGPIVEIARQSPVFRGLVLNQLRQRRPPLANGENDFIESLPLRGAAPVRDPAPGALAIQAYLARAEWLTQSANPVAFAPYLRQAPLPGVPPRPILFQWAVGDQTVPNPTTTALLDAGLLWPVSSLYRHDVLGRGLPDRFHDPHAFFTWTGWTAFPEVYAIGRAAQEQAARFFLSGGRQIEAVIPQLETAGRLPAATP
jgi:Bacterial virulence factor lipase N-terminal